MIKPFSRREFLAILGSVSMSGCAEQPSPERYSKADRERLLQQKRTEAIRSGQGRFGVQRYRGYRGLAELPWFELDKNGKLFCSDDSIPSAIDMHCHLGMSVLFEPELDLHSEKNRTRHLLDCDENKPGCELDLDKYVNANFTEDSLKTLKSTIRSQGLWGNDFSESQTLPNLLTEMDAMRVDKAAILPIKLGLWFGDNQTEHWREATADPKYNSRLLSAFSVHPRDDNKVKQLKDHAASGKSNAIKLMKLHPTVQRFYPDAPSMMELYQAAEKQGVTIFFHGGRAGIEPESSHPYALPRHYEAVFANFPNLKIIVGHAGARDSDQMLKIAHKYDNVWLDIHGQSVSQLGNMIKTFGGERMVFGSDWPFYHLGASLAKVLITTQKETGTVREKILRGNAEQFIS